MNKGVDFPGVSIVYFCHDGKGNVLMQKRGKNARDEQGCWDIGGGALEHGMTVEDMLTQEINEEYMTDVLDFTFLGYRDVHRGTAEQPTHWIALDFLVRVDANKAGNGEPHKFDEVRWFRINDIPDTTHSQLPAFLHNYRDQLGI